MLAGDYASDASALPTESRPVSACCRIAGVEEPLAW